MISFRGAVLLPIVFFTPQVSVAEGLQFYVSKAAMDCIVANEATYVAAKTYDFVIVFPAVCPELPDDAQTTVGNEYLQLPDSAAEPPTEPKAIIVPINQFACLGKLMVQTVDADPTDLLLVDLESCSILQRAQSAP